MPYYLCFGEVENFPGKFIIAALIDAFKVPVKHRRGYRVKECLKEINVVFKVFFYFLTPGDFHR
ncbi:hypothetical protein DSECCO2_503060 [anaerobic digester metagenome]